MSDYPDYFGVSIFPSYGVMTHIEKVETITSGNSKVLFDISDKGVLYFCHVESILHAAFDDFTMTFIIDGFTFSEMPFSTIFKTSASGLSSLPFACFAYIPETPYLVIGLIRPIPFLSQVRLSIENDDATDIRIFVVGAYAKIS